MNTYEKGWTDKREEYLTRAYSAVKADQGFQPLNKALENWEVLSDGADRRYFWRALRNFDAVDALKIDEQLGQKLLDIDRDLDLSMLAEDGLEPETEKTETVRRSSESEFRSYGGFESPEIPLFIAREHADRHGYEVFPHESPGLRGFAALDETADGKQTWSGFYVDDEDRRSSMWVAQVFGEPESDREAIFGDQNRQNYLNRIWDQEYSRIRSRSNYVWDSAVEAVEERLPEIAESYEERWGREIDEKDALRRELRLMVGDDEYDEENPTYIEQIPEAYFSGEIRRASDLLEPLLRRTETKPDEEGDMPFGEAFRDSDTSRSRKQRNKTYMTHYLDLVWQMADEAY